MTAQRPQHRVEHLTPAAQRHNDTATRRSRSFVMSRSELTMADECTGASVRSQCSFRDNRNTSPPAPTTALIPLVALIMRRRSSPSRSFVLAALRALHLDRSHTTTNNAANNRNPDNANMPPPKRPATERQRPTNLRADGKCGDTSGGPGDLPQQ